MNNVLHKEVWIDSNLEDVFAHFTNAEAMLKWHGKEVELDPVPGGIYKVTFENGTTIIGAYIEVEPNKRVLYSARYGNVDSTVEVRFEEERGGVRVKIRQEFETGQDLSSFDHGWDYFLHLLQLRWARS